MDSGKRERDASEAVVEDHYGPVAWPCEASGAVGGVDDVYLAVGGGVPEFVVDAAEC